MRKRRGELQRDCEEEERLNKRVKRRQRQRECDFVLGAQSGSTRLLRANSKDYYSECVCVCSSCRTEREQNHMFTGSGVHPHTRSYHTCPAFDMWTYHMVLFLCVCQVHISFLQRGNSCRHPERSVAAVLN